MIAGLALHPGQGLAEKEEVGSVAGQIGGIHVKADFQPPLGFAHDVGLVEAGVGPHIGTRIVSHPHGLDSVEEQRAKSGDSRGFLSR